MRWHGATAAAAFPTCNRERSTLTSAQCKIARGGSDPASFRVCEAPHSGTGRGNVLVTHGLSLKPAPLCEWGKTGRDRRVFARPEPRPAQRVLRRVRDRSAQRRPAVRERGLDVPHAVLGAPVFPSVRRWSPPVMVDALCERGPARPSSWRRGMASLRLPVVAIVSLRGDAIIAFSTDRAMKADVVRVLLRRKPPRALTRSHPRGLASLNARIPSLSCVTLCIRRAQSDHLHGKGSPFRSLSLAHPACACIRVPHGTHACDIKPRPASTTARISKSASSGSFALTLSRTHARARALTHTHTRTHIHN